MRSKTGAYFPTAEHLALINKILDSAGYKGTARRDLLSTMKHFFCYIEGSGIDAGQITDRDILLVFNEVSIINRSSIAGGREWFFQQTDGSPVPVRRMTKLFRKCRKKSSGCAEVRTRPYDLRHAFATHTLMQWIENGNDVMALLPYLSAYMGHSKISSTFYYIHLLPQRLRESAGIEWDTLDEIYREGEHYEEI